MTRLATIALALLACAAIAAPHHMVVARKNVAVGAEAYIFEEDFDLPGYENAWDETNDAEDGVYVVSDQYVTGTNSLYVDGQAVSGTNHYAFIDLGVDGGRTDFYWRVYVRLGGIGDDVWVGFDANGTTPGSRDNGAIFISSAVGSTPLYVYTDPGVTHTINSPTTSDWIRIEGHYPHGTVRIDGSETDYADDASIVALRYIMIGDSSGAGDDGNAWFDGIAISTNDWIGAAP